MELRPADLFGVSGVSPLVLIVREIGQHHPRLEWVRIVGTEVGPDGSMAYAERVVLARVEALRDARRPVGWLP
ncbi:hypothetical protein ACIA8K_08115 [Catenuloplanes sp. NPDC051500]|uniref:hypothetical protein n=1 Tax=Catenuloplanes sp. NPDC051500 TaxID=3363959 RepID=UPI0037ABD43E